MRSKTFHLLAAAALSAVMASTAAAEPLLASIFQDHAVLQRGQPIRVWGAAAPGQTVELDLSGAKAAATADAEGRWSATLPAREPGAPLSLTATAGGQAQTITDLLVGDVWLCSGQSNMEYPLSAALNGASLVAGAADPNIRLLQTGKISLPTPSSSLPASAKRQVATPASAANFSAACLFMGRDLKRATGAPVGLIDASWGGSIIQDWISRPSLTALGGYEARLAMLAEYARSPQAGMDAWAADLAVWSKSRSQPGGWHEAATDDSAWPSFIPSGPWETAGVPELADFNGVVWFRTTVTLTKAQAKQGARLALGPIDDSDVTWINGVAVGAGAVWNAPRDYRVTPGVLRPGKNVIAVRVADGGQGGGLWGTPDQRALRLDDGSVVPVGPSWRWKIGGPVQYSDLPPAPPWQGAAGLTTLYNGMIAPLAPYGLKGFAWYQGESNTGDPAEYGRLMPTMIADWRRAFGGERLPFVMVQLASYGPLKSAPAESGWAGVRDVQRRVAAADPMVGMASAVDIGDIYDIHPANKLQVGLRLALHARRLAHGETALVAAGPAPLTARRDGASVVVALDQRAVVVGGHAPIGFELCDAAACRFVDAAAQGDSVRLAVPGGLVPTKVRYAWAESPILNLYGATGLPATPFEIPVN